MRLVSRSSLANVVEPRLDFEFNILESLGIQIEFALGLFQDQV